MTSLTGRWRIVEMDMWDQDAIDLVEPGFIEFAEDGTGRFGFIAVRGRMDCRSTERGGRPLVEFSWDGDDEGDQVGGRGWAALGEDGAIDRAPVHPQGRRLGLPRDRRSPARAVDRPLIRGFGVRVPGGAQTL